MHLILHFGSEEVPHHSPTVLHFFVLIPYGLHYWRAGASLPSRTTGAIFLYIYIYFSTGAAHTVYF